MADLVLQATDVMREMADESGVTLSVAPQPARVVAASDRIIQTITNLLSNAIKFSPRGATVWVTTETHDAQVLVQVKDEGRGIPDDMLESIFERFQQVDASGSREKGGTGLGFVISRSIVQQHRGRIWAESTLGKGEHVLVYGPDERRGGSVRKAGFPGTPDQALAIGNLS